MAVAGPAAAEPGSGMPEAPELGFGGLGNGGARAEPAFAPSIGSGICSMSWLAKLLIKLVIKVIWLHQGQSSNPNT